MRRACIKTISARVTGCEITQLTYGGFRDEIGTIDCRLRLPHVDGNFAHRMTGLGQRVSLCNVVQRELSTDERPLLSALYHLCQLIKHRRIGWMNRNFPCIPGLRAKPAVGLLARDTSVSTAAIICREACCVSPPFVSNTKSTLLAALAGR